MNLSKQMLIGLILLQSVIILFLAVKGIALRNEALFAKAEATYYKKAYQESSDEDLSLRELLDERNNLLHEYEITRDAVRKKDQL